MNFRENMGEGIHWNVWNEKRKRENDVVNYINFKKDKHLIQIEHNVNITRIFSYTKITITFRCADGGLIMPHERYSYF